MNSGKDFPIICNLQVNKVFRESFQIVLYHGITTFIGPNGIGKTQTLKVLRDYLKQVIGQNAVRYLSSNRIGLMEQYSVKRRIDSGGNGGMNSEALQNRQCRIGDDRRMPTV